MGDVPVAYPDPLHLFLKILLFCFLSENFLGENPFSIKFNIEQYKKHITYKLNLLLVIILNLSIPEPEKIQLKNVSKNYLSFLIF